MNNDEGAFQYAGSSTCQTATPSGRKRTSNFTNQEKLALMELVSMKYKNILENKKTDKSSIDERLNAWRRIETEYNSNSPSGIFRDWETLKRLYENRKREVRKIMAKERQLRLKTGGGPDPKFELDPGDQILLEIVNQKTVSGLTNAIDSDSDFTIPVPSSIEEQEYVFIDANTEMENLLDVTESIETQSGQLEGGFEKFTVSKDNNDNDSPAHLTWRKASDLKRKIDPALQNNSKVPKKVPRRNGNLYSRNAISKPRESVKILTSSDIANKYNILLESRQVLVQKQIENVDEEITFGKTKHKLEIELLSLEVAKKKKEILQ